MLYEKHCGITAFLIVVFLVTGNFLHTNETNLENEKMSKEKNDMQIHHQFAVELNGLVWNLLSKTERTEAEDDIMIHAAHTSYYHWSKVGTEINLQRGHWLISRVYSVLNRPESALYHAKKCLELTEQHQFVDFDLAYAYEAMARAHATNGNKTEYETYYQLALEAAEQIKAKEDKDFFLSDLQTEPWHSIK